MLDTEPDIVGFSNRNIEPDIDGIMYRHMDWGTLSETYEFADTR